MEKTKVGIVLQARLDSVRLPGKSMLPLGGRPLVLRVMETLRRVPAEVRVLACPEDAVAAFRPLTEAAGFRLFAGPKDDVLARYCLAAREFALTHVIRATGDNPFLFADAAADIASRMLALGVDYAGFSGLPLGAGVEAVTAAALFAAEANARLDAEREHVCPYLYGHPEIFRVHRVLAPRHWQAADIRITVDTEEDYRRAKLLYDALDAGEKAGRLSEGRRYKGEAIIDTYLKVFRDGDSRASDGWDPA